MSSQSHRVFVGNLPHEVTKDEILSKFSKYCTVESVEIRTKNDPSTGDPLATFSFVNISGDRDSLNQSAHMLNGIKFGGRHIKVELAKESFLQRLQRERQAGNKTAPPSVPNSPQVVPPINTGNVIKKSIQEEKKVIKKKPASSSSESSDSEDETVKFHHTSKLPMFKGIKLQMSNESDSKPQLEPETDKSTSYTSSVRGIYNGESNKFSTKGQFQSKNSDILKKFESFSDVWKDDDEPSNQNDSFGSKFRQGDRNQKFDKFPSRNSFANEANNWGSQNQRHHKFPNRNSFADEGNDRESQNQHPSMKSKSVNAAEEKRLKSLDEKRQAFEQQKKAVKLALSDKSAPQVNQKIVFGDDDDEPEVLREKQNFKKTTESVKGQKHNALTLFDDSDDEAPADDWKNQFEIKKQFQGEKGKKLLQLQSNFNNDQRFNLDERFYEGEQETNLKSSFKPSTRSDLSEERVDTIEGIEGLAEEREQQLQILSSILGQTIPTTQQQIHHESKTKGMLRFDPSKPNHTKYELSREPKEKKKKKKKGEEDEEDDAEEESNKRKFRREEKEPEPVSENKFYNVSDTLADTLKQAKEGQNSGFSLLQMFGSSNVPTENHEKVTPEPRIEPLRKDLKKRPILDDSSSDEEGPTADYNTVEQDKAFPTSNPGVRSSHGVWQESFFLQSGDSRLKEGDSFLKFKEDKTNDIVQKRHGIVKIIATKRKKLDSVWRKNDMPTPKGGRNPWKAPSRNKIRNFKPKRKER